MKASPLICAILLSFASLASSATVHYVSVSSTNPAPPYLTWDTAAVTIQDAVDAATPGDEILVTNGVYATGGRAVYGTMTNRVAVDKPLTLRSVNGPEVTIIEGYQVLSTTNGESAIRCVYLTNAAVLTGFTITNGATQTFWTLSPESVGGGIICSSKDAVVSNCVIVGNSAQWYGSGVFMGSIFNSTLKNNSANYEGGAAAMSILTGCTIVANTGSGACRSELYNCSLVGNSAPEGAGGGASQCTLLNNCFIAGNSCAYQGGGVWGGTLNNCTIVDNSAGTYGGGAGGCTLNNCIAYFNNAPDEENYSQCTFNYSCTTPLPGAGLLNISADPQFASSSHLSATSPCRRAGSIAYASGTDINDQPWANPPSIGSHQYWPGTIAGPLSVCLHSAYTNVSVGFAVEFSAFISGKASLNVWDFGDGMFVSNRLSATHAWGEPGEFLVVLRAFNESFPYGVSATARVWVVEAPVYYVAAASTNPVPPYLSWATAAYSIQDAVDLVSLPGALVLVSNGVYSVGGRAVDGIMTNRVVIDKPALVCSVNGPAFTIIQGYQVPETTNGNSAVRCLYLTNSAILSGFTLTNGATLEGFSGGGAWCASRQAKLSNCIIIANSAYAFGGGVCSGTIYNCSIIRNSARVGAAAYFATINSSILASNSAFRAGATYGGILNNLVLIGNSAVEAGGGAWFGTFNNCTIVANSASGVGGGVFHAALNNCILGYNAAWDGANYWQSTLNYCCTTPLPETGRGNITDLPRFADYLNGNLNLDINSPCINSGHNAYIVENEALNGTRIVGGTVDIGAYEFPIPLSSISFAWLQRYGFEIFGGDDYADPDRDGINNWQEWRCGTDPTNSSSALRLLAPQTNGSNVLVSWQSVAGINYFLERSTNLSVSPPFQPLATNLPGLSATTAYTDSNPPPQVPIFYRIGVPD